MAGFQNKSFRQYDLDWLRVLVILNLVPYHAVWLMRYIPGFSQAFQGHTGNTILDYYVVFIACWHMPLLFFIAGTTIHLSLSRRSVAAYLKERVERLVVPLVFFILAGYPLMAYFLPGAGENKGVTDYLFRFWPFCLTHPTGNWLAGGRPIIPCWGHLWFVAYLLVISVVTLPLLIYLRKSWADGLPAGIVRVLSHPWGLLLPSAVLILIRASMAPRWPMFLRHTLIGDWTFLCYLLATFLCGFVFRLDERILASARKWYRFWLVPALACSGVVIILRFNRPAAALAPSYAWDSILYSALVGLDTWLWIVVLLGLARRFLSNSNAFLRYFNQASYPFYILHLVVMTAVGYWITRWGLGLWSEFVVLSILSFIGTIAIYDLCVRRNRFGRFLLGMKS